MKTLDNFGIFPNKMLDSINNVIDRKAFCVMNLKSFVAFWLPGVVCVYKYLGTCGLLDKQKALR